MCVCERLCVTTLCVCVRELVCERWCVTKLCVAKLCVCVTKSYLREMDSLAAWMSASATPATQNEGRCCQVPRLPRKVATRQMVCDKVV